MAYPSNENTGAKNLVDFVVHLRDSEDGLKETIVNAKYAIEEGSELMTTIRENISDVRLVASHIDDLDVVSQEVRQAQSSPLASKNAAAASATAAAEAASRAESSNVSSGEHETNVVKYYNDTVSAASKALGDISSARNAAVSDISSSAADASSAASKALDDISVASSTAMSSISTSVSDAKRYRDEAAAIVTPDGLAGQVTENSDALSQFKQDTRDSFGELENDVLKLKRTFIPHTSDVDLSSAQAGYVASWGSLNTSSSTYKYIVLSLAKGEKVSVTTNASSGCFVIARQDFSSIETGTGSSKTYEYTAISNETLYISFNTSAKYAVTKTYYTISYNSVLDKMDNIDVISNIINLREQDVYDIENVEPVSKDGFYYSDGSFNGSVAYSNAFIELKYGTTIIVSSAASSSVSAIYSITDKKNIFAGLGDSDRYEYEYKAAKDETLAVSWRKDKNVSISIRTQRKDYTSDISDVQSIKNFLNPKTESRFISNQVSLEQNKGYFIAYTSTSVLDKRNSSTHSISSPIHIEKGKTIRVLASASGSANILSRYDKSNEKYYSLSDDYSVNGPYIGNEDYKIRKYEYTATSDIDIVVCWRTQNGASVFIGEYVDIMSSDIVDKDTPTNIYESFGDSEIIDIDKPDYVVIMMYGQSLSIGQESGYSWPEAFVDGCYMLDKNPLAISGEDFFPLASSYDINGQGVAIGRCQPVVTAVNNFVKMYRAEHPYSKTKFVVCSLGQGGISLACLSSARRYPKAMMHLLDTNVALYFDAVKSIASSKNATIALGAILWMHGESDYISIDSTKDYTKMSYSQWLDDMNSREVNAMNMGGSYHAYYTGLSYLYDDIYQLAKSKFGDAQSGKPAFFAHCVGGKFTTNNAYLGINMATHQLCEDNAFMFQVAPVYQLPDYINGHLNVNGDRWYGEWCARAMYTVFSLHKEWTPMYPYDFAVDGKKVIISVGAKRLPLVFDSEMQGGTEWVNKGFCVRAGSVSQLESARYILDATVFQNITNVRIKGNTIEIECENDLTSFQAVEVTYGSGLCGGSGNLRDSDKWRAFDEYKTDEGDHGNQHEEATWTVPSVATPATDEELSTLPWLDFSILNGAGYSKDAKVLVHDLRVDNGVSVATSKINGNKIAPYNEVMNAPNIVGQRYPMYNWMINFYKRIVL